MELIITRHGETLENIEGILQGQTLGTLSPNGIQQIKKLAKRLKDKEIDFIFSSDLKRAVDTTKEIIKYHPNTKVSYVKELREKDLGEFQGKKRDEIGWDSKRLVALSEPKSGETIDIFYNRIENFLNKIIEKYHNKKVLFVSHGGVSKVLIAVIRGKNCRELDSVERILNTSITIFEIDKNRRYKNLSLNCVEHLNYP